MNRLTIFLFLVSSLARAGVWIDLSGEWKIASHRDDPAFAQPGYDDSGWTSVRLPATPGLFGPTPSWLRRTVSVGVETKRDDLAITIGTLQDVYEVFVNGVRVGQSGEFDDLSIASVPRPRSFRIPAEVALRGAPGALVIAIRAKSAMFLPPQYRMPDEGPYLLASADETPWHEGERLLDRKWRSFSLYLLLIGLFMAFAVISVLGRWAEPRRTELLWFAGFAAANALLLYQLIAMLHPQASFSAKPFNQLFLSIAGLYVIGAQFALTAVGARSKWLYALLWAGCAAALPFRFLANVWSLSLGAAAVGVCLVRDWKTISIEERALRIVLLAGLGDSVANWILILAGHPPLDQLQVGEYLVGRSNLSWSLLALTILILLFRRGARERRERERLAAELEAASEIQRLLLAQPALAGGGLSLEASYLPAQEVGGDFYCVVDRRTLVLGDVSGKGLKAAMVVSLVMGSVRTITERSPAAVLSALNRAVAGQVDGFITCCCLHFTEGGRQVTIANAGHPGPYLNGTEVLTESGLPLGLVADAEYAETAFYLDSPSVLTLVSDGVIEATNAQGELFGFERTREISAKSATEIAEDARAWGQNDDITVVTVRRRTV